MVGVGSAVATDGAEEGKDALVDQAELLARLLRAEEGPAEMRVGRAAFVGAFKKDAAG